MPLTACHYMAQCRVRGGVQTPSAWRVRRRAPARLGLTFTFLVMTCRHECTFASVFRSEYDHRHELLLVLCIATIISRHQTYPNHRFTTQMAEQNSCSGMLAGCGCQINAPKTALEAFPAPPTAAKHAMLDVILVMLVLDSTAT